jgi:hypothetical protein
VLLSRSRVLHAGTSMFFLAVLNVEADVLRPLDRPLSVGGEAGMDLLESLQIGTSPPLTSPPSAGASSFRDQRGLGLIR